MPISCKLKIDFKTILHNPYPHLKVFINPTLFCKLKYTAVHHWSVNVSIVNPKSKKYTNPNAKINPSCAADFRGQKGRVHFNANEVIHSNEVTVTQLKQFRRD